MLVGYPPFNHDTQDGLYDKIKRIDYDFIGSDWRGISRDSMLFIQALLTPEAKRLNPYDALNHPWLQIKGAATQTLETTNLL